MWPALYTISAFYLPAVQWLVIWWYLSPSGIPVDWCGHSRIWFRYKHICCYSCVTSPGHRDHALGKCLSHSVLIDLTIVLFIQTAVNHFFLWASIIFTFIFNYVYCAIDTRQRIIDTLFVMQMASTRAIFWLVLVITPVIALLPR